MSQKTAARTQRRKRKRGTVNQDRAVTRSAKSQDQETQSDPEEDTKEAPEVLQDSESDSDSEEKKKVQFENA